MGVVVRECTARGSRCQTAPRRCARLRIRCDGFLAIRERGLRPRRRSGTKKKPKKTLNPAEGVGDRERCLATACALGVEQRERDILPSASIYGISALRPIYIYIGSSAECASRPNNCFWKCEQRALINASTVALKRSVNYSSQWRRRWTRRAAVILLFQFPLPLMSRDYLAIFITLIVNNVLLPRH